MPGCLSLWMSVCVSSKLFLNHYLYSFSLIFKNLEHMICQYIKNCGIDFLNFAFKIFGEFFKKI